MNYRFKYREYDIIASDETGQIYAINRKTKERIEFSDDVRNVIDAVIKLRA